MPKRGVLGAIRTVEGLIARLALLAVVLPVLLKGVAAFAPLPADPVLSAISAGLCLADAGQPEDRASPERGLCCVLCGPPGSAAPPSASALPFVLPDPRRIAVPLPPAPSVGLRPALPPGRLSLRGPPVLA